MWPVCISMSLSCISSHQKLMHFVSSTDVNYIASQAIARAQASKNAQANGTAVDVNGENNDAPENESADAIAALERQARAPVGFVPASSGPQNGQAVQSSEAVAPVANPDAIEVDVDDDDD